MASHRRGIVMNGFTGPVRLNQHLVRSIVAVRQRGGVALPNGDRVVPDPIPVGCNADKVSALARQYGIERSAANLAAALKNPNDTMFFDAAMIQMHADLVSQAVEVGKHVYRQKPISATLDKVAVVDF